MTDGPDISIVAAMIGDPARSNMLLALMSGLSLTAAELAREAGVTPSTASGHLAKLKDAGLVLGKRQGRYHYFRIADTDVAHAVEALVTVAARAGHLRTRPGPKDESLRRSRSCYDHLAGRLAVDLYDHWATLGILHQNDAGTNVTVEGEGFLTERGIDVTLLKKSKRPLCRTCIDWSERRNHLGGSVGAAILTHILSNAWATRDGGTRVVRFSRTGEQQLVAWYSVPPPE